jgi:hypothetical protein
MGHDAPLLRARLTPPARPAAAPTGAPPTLCKGPCRPPCRAAAAARTAAAAASAPQMVTVVAHKYQFSLLHPQDSLRARSQLHVGREGLPGGVAAAGERDCGRNEVRLGIWHHPPRNDARRRARRLVFAAEQVLAQRDRHAQHGARVVQPRQALLGRGGNSGAKTLIADGARRCAASCSAATAACGRRSAARSSRCHAGGGPSITDLAGSSSSDAASSSALGVTSRRWRSTADCRTARSGNRLPLHALRVAQHPRREHLHHRVLGWRRHVALDGRGARVVRDSAARRSARSALMRRCAAPRRLHASMRRSSGRVLVCL